MSGYANMTVGAKIGIAAGVVTMVGGTVGLVIYVLSAGAAWGEASGKIETHDLDIKVVKEEVSRVKGNQMVVQSDTASIKQEVQRAREKQEQMSAGQARIEAQLQYIIEQQQRQASSPPVPVHPNAPPGYPPPQGYPYYPPQGYGYPTAPYPYPSPPR